MTTKKKILFNLIFFGLIFSIFEICSYYLAKKVFISRGLIYSPPAIEETAYKEYQKKRHNSLGWIVAKNQEKEIDQEGSRLIPSFPYNDSTVSCISLYGDSYTFSNRTTPEEAWSNQLSLLLNCRVSNFGVSGYGTGQALMRFLENTVDSSKIVFLNHFVDDIPRNVSQHWGTRFSTQRQAFAFKPRFILNHNGKLEKVPLPNFSFEELTKLQEDPKEYLKHDFFVPGSDYGSVHLKFPYSFAVVKTLLFHSKFRTLYSGIPTHAPFYEETHPSQSLQLTAQIMTTFKQEALKQGKKPIVTIIPFSSDFDYFRKSNEWCYQSLLTLLETNNVEVINLGAEIEKELRGKDQSYLYAGEGHFNANGDKLIAKVIYEYLKENHHP